MNSLLSTGTIAPMTFKFKWIMVRGLVLMVIFGNPSTVAITTKLRSADCGKNLPAIGTTYASLSTADSWDFEVKCN